MNRNTKISITAAVALVLIIGVGIGCYIHSKKTTTVSTGPTTTSTPNVVTDPTPTAKTPYNIGESRTLSPIGYSDFDEFLKKAIQKKTVKNTRDNLNYTAYLLKQEDADFLGSSRIIVKIDLERDYAPLPFFDTQINDVDSIGNFHVTDSGLELTSKTQTSEDERAYLLEFSPIVLGDNYTPDSLRVMRLVSESIRNSYKKTVADFSAALTKNGIANEYKNNTLVGFDIGTIYHITLIDNTNYQINVMSPDFSIGIGEGIPTWFTPNKVDFTASTDILHSQFLYPTDILYSDKITIEGQLSFVIFTYCGYPASNYCVQIRTKDSRNMGYVVNIDVDDSYKENPEIAVQKIITSPLVKNIFSSINSQESTAQPTREHAKNVISALRNADFSQLSTYTHPEKGIRFSPYIYVQKDSHLVFKVDSIKNLLNDTKVYTWGTYDGSGFPIELTPKEYYDQFVYSRDFANVAKITYNDISNYNTQKILETYPQSTIVEYYYPGTDPKFEGMDWQSLRLVFEEFNGTWYLVGIVHDEWMI